MQNKIYASNQARHLQLHIAAANKKYIAVQLLIESKTVDINARDSQGRSVLHYAALHNDLEMATLLLGQGISTAIQDNTRCTALHYAAKENNIDIIQLLIRCKANPFILAVNGISASDMASTIECKNILLKYEALCKTPENLFNLEYPKQSTSLHLAAFKGLANVIPYLVQKGEEIDALNSNNKTPLYLAVLCGHQDTLDILLHYHPNPFISDHTGRRPSEVCQNSHQKLQLCLYENICSSAERLRELTWTNNVTPLHYAAQRNWIEVMRDLISYYITNINAQDSNGWTPLHFAAYYNNCDAASFLLDNRANPLILSNNQQTASDLCSDAQLKTMLLNRKLSYKLLYHHPSKPVNAIVLEDTYIRANDPRQATSLYNGTSMDVEYNLHIPIITASKTPDCNNTIFR